MHEPKKQTVGFWTIAIVIAVGLHVALGIGLVYFQPVSNGTIGAPESIMLEFADVPTAPDVDEESETIQQAIVTEKIDPVEEQNPEEQETSPEEIKPQVETPKSDIQEEVKKPEEKPKKTEPKKEKKQVKKQQNKKPIREDVDKGDKNQKATGPRLNADRGNQFRGPNNNRQDGSYGRRVKSWQDKVQSRIAYVARRTPKKGGGGQKTVYIMFRFDKGGNITAASVARSSGDDGVDTVALQMVRKATPIPAPPEGWSGPLTVPVLVR